MQPIVICKSTSICLCENPRECQLIFCFKIVLCFKYFDYSDIFTVEIK